MTTTQWKILFLLVVIAVFLVVGVILIMNPSYLEGKSGLKINLVTHWDDKSDIPVDFLESWEEMKKELPGLRPVLLDNEICMRSVLKGAEKKAFQSLVPQAYKSDLCRLVYLYKHGGLYVDIKFRPGEFPIMRVIGEKMLVSDIIHENILNGFLVAEAGDPWIKKSIDKILQNVETRNYAKDDLSITGPGLLGETAGPSEREREKLVFIKSDDHNSVVDKETREVVAWFSNKYTAKSKFKRYGQLWNERKVFQ